MVVIEHFERVYRRVGDTIASSFRTTADSTHLDEMTWSCWLTDGLSWWDWEHMWTHEAGDR